MGVNGIYGLSGSGMDIESMVKVGMMSIPAYLTAIIKSISSYYSLIPGKSKILDFIGTIILSY